MQNLLRSQRAFFYLYTSTRSALRFRFMRFSIACSFFPTYLPCHDTQQTCRTEILKQSLRALL